MKKAEMSEINQLKVDLRNKTAMYENQKQVSINLRKEVKRLKEENKKKDEIIKDLKLQVSNLEWLVQKLLLKIDKLEKNSTNSSKPPSMDIVKKNKSLRWKSWKKSWWQEWHKGCCKNKIKNPDKIIQCKPNICPFCGAKIDEQSKFFELWRRQVIDIPEVKQEVTEYVLMGTKCKCGKKIKWEYPKWVKWPVNYGNNLQAFVWYLNVKHSIPYKRLSNIFSDILSINISEWTIDNILWRLAEKIQPYSNNILSIIKRWNWVWSDETWTRVNTENWYCWTWQNLLWTYYYSIKSRAYEVVRSIFWEDYRWTIVHDCFGAQNNTEAKDHQLCHPHQLRDLIFCLEKENSVWASKIIELLLKSEKAQEHIWQDWFDENIRKNVQKYYIDKLDMLLEVPPETKEALRIYKRFKKYRSWIFTFMKYKDVPHHNNSSEQAMRIHKVKKKISWGFRSIKWIERHDTILSFLDTTKKQNRNTITSIKQAIEWKFFFCIN